MSAAMQQVLHLLRKDLRHTRWVIAIWLTIVAADFVLRLIDSGAGASDPPRTLFAVSGGWRFFLTAMVAILFVSMTVHADPLPGSRAFWLTRPIGRARLFASKAAGLLLVLVLPGLLTVIVFLAGWGIQGGALLRASLEVLIPSLLGLAVLFAAAALTDRLGQMLLLLAAEATLLVLVGLMAPWLHDWLGPEPGRRLPLIDMVWFLPALVLIATFAAVTAGTWWTYRTRTRAAVITQLMALSIIVMLLPRLLDAALSESMWPQPPTVSEPWAASDRVVARVEWEKLRSKNVTYRSGSRHGASADPYGVELMAPVVLDGLPTGYVATPEVSAIAWDVDNEKHREQSARLVSAQQRGDAWPPTLVGPPDIARFPPELSAADGDPWPALLTLARKNYQRQRTQPGHYTATVRFTVRRHEVIDTQPLRAGVTPDGHARRFEVVRTADDDGSCRFDARWVALQFVFTRFAEPTIGYRFMDGAGTPLYASRNRSQMWRDFAMLPFTPTTAPTPLRVSFETLWLSHRRDAGPYGAGREEGPVTPVTCGEVRWSAVRVTNVGTITRRIDIPDLVLADWEPTDPPPLAAAPER